MNKVSNWHFCSLLLVLLVFFLVPDFGHTGDLTKDLLGAAKEGNLNNLEALISDGADVNSAEVASNTPLIIATKFGHIECVKFLLENGASLDAKEHLGWTALMKAVYRGHVQIVRALVENGANVRDYKSLLFYFCRC